MKRLILGAVACMLLASQAQAQVYNSGALGWAWGTSPGTAPLGGFTHTFSLPDIQSVNEICLDISHSWGNDLDIWIDAPGGGSFDFDLMFNELSTTATGNFDLGTAVSPAGAAAAFHFGNVATYRFNAVGANNWIAPYSAPGLYNANAWLAGPIAAGTWTLRVEDTVGGDGGAIGNLKIGYSQVPEPSSLLLALMGLSPIGLIRRRRSV
jgi:hypothetical protein